MQQLTLISVLTSLLIFSISGSVVAAQEIVPCEALYEVSADEITESNAQVFFQDAIDCNSLRDSTRDILFKHISNLQKAITLLGGRHDRFVATRNAIAMIENNGIDAITAPIAWRHTVAGLVAVQTPLDARDYLFILSNIAVQNQIFGELGIGSEVDLSAKLLKVYLVPLNSEFGREVVDAENYGTRAICFVKSDIGGSVEEIFASYRYLQCINRN